MLKNLAAAALMACLVPAAALACEGHPAEQRAVKPVESKKVMLAQKLDLKQFQKAGNSAASSIKKDANKVNLNKSLQGADKNLQSATSGKKKPKARQLSAPKAK